MSEPTPHADEPTPYVPELAPPLVPSAPPVPPMAPVDPPFAPPPQFLPPYAPPQPFPPTPSAPPQQFLPPYARPIPPGGSASPGDGSAPHAGYPAVSTPSGSGDPLPRRGAPVALIVSIGVALLLLLIAGAAIWLVMPHPSAAPAAPQHTTAASDPASEPNSSTEPGSSQTATAVKATLDAMVENYKQSARDGSLWQKIPDTDRNRTALQAFLYVITDLRSAMLWGVDDSTAAGYLADAKEYERKLLAQQPLGTSVKITNKGKTFSYDGDTGEGGWS